MVATGIEKSGQAGKLVGRKLWYCGSYNTAMKCIGCINICLIILTYCTYMYDPLVPQSITYYVTCSVMALVIIFVNAILIAGAIKNILLLFVPWLLVHAILAVLVAWIIIHYTFRLNIPALSFLLFLDVYFYVIVCFHAQRLYRTRRGLSVIKNTDQPPKIAPLPSTDQMDETFTQLAQRKVIGVTGRTIFKNNKDTPLKACDRASKSTSACLLSEINTTFTPFQKKGLSVSAENMPKIKIVLPKYFSSDDESESDN